MENISQDPIIKQTLLYSIDREELLLKKYDTYNAIIEDKETKEMLKEFKETAQEHINLIKNKFKKLVV